MQDCVALTSCVPQMCAVHGARLCSQDEIFDTPAYMGGMKPFFGTRAGYVPVNSPRGWGSSDASEVGISHYFAGGGVVGCVRGSHG